ncbi:MAG: hypothetical protein LBF41_06160, partial [Deltaproteobacteria bacterium]|nr:hypothetical protein [Deltaproteobacteria bacterium]
SIHKLFHENVKYPPRIYVFIVYGPKVKRFKPISNYVRDFNFKPTLIFISEIGDGKEEDLFVIFDKMIENGEKPGAIEAMALVLALRDKTFNLNSFIKMMRIFRNPSLYKDEDFRKEIISLMDLLYTGHMTREQFEETRRTDMRTMYGTGYKDGKEYGEEKGEKKGKKKGAEELLRKQVGQHLKKGTPPKEIASASRVTQKRVTELIEKLKQNGGKPPNR